MSKLTRKHYNRKLLIGGIMGFASIALVSTGFATYVLSTNAENKVNGNVTIGTVTEASLKFNDVKLSKPNFLFEPLESDTTGRVRNDSKSFECMSITVSGEVENAQYLNELSISLELNETFKKAIDANYLVAPECASKEIKLDLTPDDSNRPNVKDFTYDIKFEWGSVFGGVNPGIYYDEVEAGLQVSDASMKETLENFRKTAYGIIDPQGEPSEGTNVFNIVLKATAN